MPNCCCCASPRVITAAAFAIVQANQERGVGWALFYYSAGFLAMFVVAHLAIRRFAPYADPLLLPVVALLNGLGLVMIHRLDLDEGSAEGSWPRRARTSRCCGRWSGSCAFSFVVIFAERPSDARPLRLHLRTDRPCPAGDSGAAAPIAVRAERRQDLDSVAGLLDSARRVLQDPAADLLLGGAGGQARTVHQRGQACPGHGPAPAA